MGATAQTISLTSATPTSSTTIGGGSSLYVGTNSGNNNLTGSSNVFLGNNSGRINTTGSNNTFLGFNSGFSNTTGYFNVFLGVNAGSGNAGGIYNVSIGVNSGLNLQGSNNTIVGTQSGFTTTGSGNVFLGNAAGYSETGSNKLYIANSGSTTPLIWGDFAASQLKLNGKVGIGAVTTFSTNALYANYKLFVTGGILTDEVRVALSANGTWADYVFSKDYNLKPLSEVEEFIKTNGHLENVPSAVEVKKDGIALGDMVRIQQEKIEELTLYIIEQNKRIEALEAKTNNK